MTSRTGGDLTPALQSLWKEGELSDVILVSKDAETFKAHKIILAAASGYFRALFIGAGRHLRESQDFSTATDEQQIRLPALSGNSLRSLLEIIYKCKSFTVLEENVEDLLTASNYLDIPVIREACCEFLRTGLSIGNCLHTLILAAQYDCHELFESAVGNQDQLCFPLWQDATFVRSHFTEIVSGEENLGLPELPKDVLQSLLSSEELETQSEDDILEAVLIWWAADAKSRSDELPTLLAAIRWKPTQIQERFQRRLEDLHVSNEERRMASRVVQQYVQDCERRGQGASASASCTASPPPRRSMPSGLLAAGGHDVNWRSLRSSEAYHPTQDVWTTAAPLPDSISFAAYTSAQGNVCVVSGSPHLCSVLLYERSQKQWQRHTPMNLPRLHAAMASVGGHLYIMGGRTGVANTELRSMEQCKMPWGAKLHGVNGSWSFCSPLCRPRTALGACAVRDRIYAVGGQDGKHVHTSAEEYDAGSDKWSLLGAQLPCERKYHSACELNGKPSPLMHISCGRVFAAGGMTKERQRLRSVVALDPREGRWTELAPMSVPRSSCGIACLHGRLYVAGGNAGDSLFHASMEAYVPEAGKWQFCAPFSQGRGSLALAPVAI